MPSAEAVTIPAEMRGAVRVPDGDSTRLELSTLPVPVPRPGEVLIRVRAASLNHADLLRTAPVDGPPVVAGLDAAGEIAAVGPAVEGVAVGDRVMAKVAGGYVQYVTVDAGLLLPVPPGTSFEDAASSVVALITEYHALEIAGRLAVGDTVLVHAASSGVGVWCVQIALALKAGRVFATARSGRADALLRSLGADRVIHTNEEQFADAVLEETGERGVDVIVDHVGGSYLSENMRCLAIRGRLVNVGRLGGAEGTLDLEQLAYKQASVIGTTSRTRTLPEQIEIVEGVRRDLLPKLADGTLRAVVDRVFSLEEAVEAQAVMARNEHVGKIVLRVP